MSLDRPTFSSRLVIPLSWEPVEGPPSAAALDALEQQNRGVLDVLLQRIDLDAAPRPRMSGSPKPGADPPEARSHHRDAEPLDYRDIILPEPREIEVGLDQIAWSSPEPLATGQWLLLRLYFSGAYREPVALLGRVADCMPGGRNGGWHIEAALSEMSEAIEQILRAPRLLRASPPSRATPGAGGSAVEAMTDPITAMASATADLGALARAASALPPALSESADAAGSGGAFLEALGAALNRIDNHIASASAAAKSFAAGDRDISLSDVMISLEEANLALQTAATVRDKVAAAYTTIMNMQV